MHGDASNGVFTLYFVSVSSSFGSVPLRRRLNPAELLPCYRSAFAMNVCLRSSSHDKSTLPSTSPLD